MKVAVKIGLVVAAAISVFSAAPLRAAEDWGREERKQAIELIEAANKSFKQGERELGEALRIWQKLEKDIDRLEKFPSLKRQIEKNAPRIKELLGGAQTRIGNYSQQTNDLLTQAQKHDKWIKRAEKLIPTDKNRRDPFYPLNALKTISQIIHDFTKVDTYQQFQQEFAANPPLLAFKLVVNKVNGYFLEGMTQSEAGLKKFRKLIKERGGETIGGGRAEGLGEYGGDRESAWAEKSGETLFRLGLVTGDGHSVWVTGDGDAWIWDDRPEAPEAKEWVNLGGRSYVESLFTCYRHAYQKQIAMAQLINWATNLHGRFEDLEAKADHRFDALMLKIPKNSDEGCRQWILEKYGLENNRQELLAISSNDKEQFTGKYIFSKPERLRKQSNDIYDLLTHTYLLEGYVREKGTDISIKEATVEIVSRDGKKSVQTNQYGTFKTDVRQAVIPGARPFSIKISHDAYRTLKDKKDVKQCDDFGTLDLEKKIKQLKTLSISPSAKTLNIGKTVTFSVLAHYKDGTSQIISNSLVNYKNAPGGTFKATGAGSFTITATYKTRSVSASLNVKKKEASRQPDTTSQPQDTKTTNTQTTSKSHAGGLTIAGPTEMVAGQGVTYTACDGGGDPYRSGSFSWNISREDIMSLTRAGNPVSGSVFKAGKSTIVLRHKGMTAYLDITIKAKVPNINGLSAKEAKSRITGVGLSPSLSVGDSAPDKASEYRVYSQAPASGAVLAENGTVTGTIYGKYEVQKTTATVPDVIGLSAKEAKRLISSSGLSAAISVGEPAAKASAQYKVRSQTPAAGSEVAPDSSVTLVIAGRYEEKEVTVPNVIGLGKLEAKLQMADAGLVVATNQGDGAPEASLSNTVQNQSLAAGTTVSKHSQITLTIYGRCEKNERCRKNQSLYYDAISAEDFSRCRQILVQSQDCAFYGSATADLNDRECSNAEIAYLNALRNQNYSRARKILAQHTDCGLYNQSVHSLHCSENLSRINAALKADDWSSFKGILAQSTDCSWYGDLAAIVKRQEQKASRRDKFNQELAQALGQFLGGMLQQGVQQGSTTRTHHGSSSGRAAQPVVKKGSCNDVRKAGSNNPERHIIDLGSGGDSFLFKYQTFTVKDILVVSQGGRTLFNSGCVGTKGWRTVRIEKSPFRSKVVVDVRPNCGESSSTRWEFVVLCPD